MGISFYFKNKFTGRNALVDRLANWFIHGIIGVAKILPYRFRVPAFGVFGAKVLGPIAGYRKIIKSNLDLVMPELSAAEKKPDFQWRNGQYVPCVDRNLCA